VLSYIYSCNEAKEPDQFDKIYDQPAYKNLTDSIQEQPERDDLYFQRAVLLNKDELVAPALIDFRKAWSLKKEEKYAFAIGNLLLDETPDMAIRFLDSAINIIPESILLRLGLARSQAAANRVDDAIKTSNDILQMNPEQVDVLLMLGDLLGKKEKRDEAIKILERAYVIAPQHLPLNYSLALEYAESRNSKVLALMDSLILMDSLGVHAEPYYYKGLYYANMKNTKKAIELFDLAIQHDYTFKESYIEKGIVLYDLKKFQDAYKVFNLLMSLSPSYPDSYYWMGKCQEALGQKQEALLNYQRAYGLDKTFAEAQEAAEKLGATMPKPKS
jgi:tetratricopeptide (TPR) repeat protein